MKRSPRESLKNESSSKAIAKSLSPLLHCHCPHWVDLMLIHLFQDISDHLYQLNPVSMISQHPQGTYLLLGDFIFICLFTKPNKCSTGFSQGLYYALNSTVAFILRQVSRTDECLWITALSMNTNTLFFASLGVLRMCFSVENMKLSKRVASKAPSMIWDEITSSWLMAAMKDIEYCCLLTPSFRIESCKLW